MGWLFSDRWESRQELLDYLRSKERWGDDFEIVRSQAVGNNHWYVAKRTDGVVFIGLDLMSGRKREWGYKDLEESMGPREVNCPVGYLDLAPDPGGYATEWRVKVREYAAEQKAKKALGPGSIVLYGNDKYTLLEKSYRRGSWRVRSANSGYTYVMSARQLSQSKVVRQEAL